MPKKAHQHSFEDLFVDSSDDDSPNRSSGEDDEDDDDSHSSSSRSSTYSDYKYVSDRGSDGEEETDYDEECPYKSPPPPPPSKRRRRKGYLDDDESSSISGPDRLSNLPEVLILQILNKLPIKDAVKTDALSKKWRYLWTFVDTISITRPYQSGLGGSDFFKDLKRLEGFITFVDKTLVLCTQSKLKKFVLDFGYERRFVSNVNLWVRFAMQKEVSEVELNLYTPRPGHRYKLPQYVFANLGVEKLILSKCRIIPHGVVGWKSLKSLTIKNSEVSSSCVQIILQGSPVLEYLELYRCYSCDGSFSFKSSSLKKLVIRGYRDPGYDVPMGFFKISAPDILSLDISGYHRLQKIRVLNGSSVVEAKLDFYLDRESADVKDGFKAKRHMLRSILGRLKHVKNLTLGSWFIQALALLEVKGFPSPLSERKSLTLFVELERSDLPGIANLLMSSPALETLVINMEPGDFHKFSFEQNFWEAHKFDEESYWTTQKVDLECSFLQLKTVKVLGLKEEAYSPLLGIVGFLLKHAPVLEKVVINGKTGCSTLAEFVQVSQKILTFPRASLDAVIVFPHLFN